MPTQTPPTNKKCGKKNLKGGFYWYQKQDQNQDWNLDQTGPPAELRLHQIHSLSGEPSDEGLVHSMSAVAATTPPSPAESSDL